MLFPELNSPDPSDNSPYLVFARKYRPQNFKQLIGQDHLVNTLTHAFDKEKIGHAYILTGVRGVGKTTTARIIAKGLNCLSSDRPTIHPCNTCSNCTSITNGKNIDVFEMDAASRTGIDDIREIIDSIPYKPLNCRYKVYIIDEVHMLSKQAFNGLLKTLEEPPGHVKFIFATTEIHKVLPTILSRCQKIELKRVSIKNLTNFFMTILQAENISFEEAALGKIASHADGSVRDGLSLLDQAVSISHGHVDITAIASMLGTTQSYDILEIIEHCLNHNPIQALSHFHRLYENGLDCTLFIKELLRITELLVRFKFTPEAIDDPSLDENFIAKMTMITQSAEIHLLSRMWEIALKGTQDIKIAPSPDAVCEMALIRMNYGLRLLDPQMTNQSEATSAQAEKKSTQDIEDTVSTKKKTVTIENIPELLKLLSQNKYLDLIRLLEVKSVVNHFENGKIKLSAVDGYDIPRKEIMALRAILNTLTKQEWDISCETFGVTETTQQSLHIQKKATQQHMITQAQDDPIIKTILETFPESKIIQITDAIAL